jgi:hypothetical protein
LSLRPNDTCSFSANVKSGPKICLEPFPPGALVADIGIVGNVAAWPNLRRLRWAGMKRERNGFMDLGPLVPVVAIASGLGWGWIGLQKKKLEVTARNALADADVQRSEKDQLAQRVAVLERIVTDRGLQTADQIEALRNTPGQAVPGGKDGL